MSESSPLEFTSESGYSLSSISMDSPFQSGGGTITKPTGGFPPIYECEPASSEESIAKREYAAPTQSVSLAEILEKRGKAPFLSLSSVKEETELSPSLKKRYGL